jgi:hypothetical protein
MRQRYPSPYRPASTTASDSAGGDDVADATAVLANRIAAALAHRKPGWTLPRQSVLARRYHVTTRQVAAAIDELAARHLIRLLPDGNACRVSPAEYMFDHRDAAAAAVGGGGPAAPGVRLCHRHHCQVHRAGRG